MSVLGVILAGGKSVRFGSDKAVAMLSGRPLIEHVALSLSKQCDAVIVAGRMQAGYLCIPDRPASNMGPLAGLSGAIAYASSAGFSHVLSAGVDTIGNLDNVRAALDPAPAYVLNQPVIGLWPVTALALLDEILGSNERRSMLHFISRLGARGVALENPPANINTPADLDYWGQKT